MWYLRFGKRPKTFIKIKGKKFESLKDAKSEHKRKLQEAMDIGKRVHEVAETVFKNMIAHPHDEITLDVDEDIFEACAALVTWIRDNDVKPVSVENKVLYKNIIV